MRAASHPDPVYLLHAFPSFALGGSQARFIQLANSLGNQFDHTVMAMDGCYDAVNGVRKLSNVRTLNIPALRGRNLNNVPRFVHALKNVKYDRVVSYNFGSIDWAFASAFVNLPHIHVEDGFTWDEAEQRLFRRSLLRSVALNLSRADVVIVSRGLSEIAKREWKISERRIHYVPNGINADSIRPALGRQRPSKFARHSETVIGSVAGLRPEKRLDRLLRAVSSMSSLDNAVLVIAGAGPNQQALEDLANSLQIRARIVFLGHVEPVSELYAEFDIFALASDTEQMPLVVLEAMAAGLPIVSTDVGDIRQMVAESNRPWIVPRSTDAFSKVLTEMTANPERRMNVGTDNFALVRQRFTSEQMYDSWRRLFSGRPPFGL